MFRTWQLITPTFHYGHEILKNRWIACIIKEILCSRFLHRCSNVNQFHYRRIHYLFNWNHFSSNAHLHFLSCYERRIIIFQEHAKSSFQEEAATEAVLCSHLRVLKVESTRWSLSDYRTKGTRRYSILLLAAVSNNDRSLMYKCLRVAMFFLFVSLFPLGYMNIHEAKEKKNTKRNNNIFHGGNWNITRPVDYSLFLIVGLTAAVWNDFTGPIDFYYNDSTCLFSQIFWQRRTSLRM